MNTARNRLIYLILLGMTVILADRILFSYPQQDKPADTPVEVVDLRAYSHPTYTRIVIELNKMREYAWEEQRDAGKIQVDVLNVRLKTELQGKIVQPKSGFISQAQIVQKNENTVRVTVDLDFSKTGRYKIWHLPDPFRVIVDILPKDEGSPTEVPISHAASGDAKIGADAKTGGAAGTTKPPVSETPPAAGDAKIGVKTGAAVKSDIPEKTEAKPGGTTERPTANLSGAPQGAANPPVPPTAETGPQPAKPSSLGYSLTRQLGLGVKMIVIDPGHGGTDPGCLGKAGSKEKDIALDVSLQLQNLLTRAGMNVLMIRDADKYVALEDRPVFANQRKADLFLSIHVNAHGNKKRSGVETFYLNLNPDPDVVRTAARENASSTRTIGHIQDAIKKILRNDRIVESRELSEQIQKNLVKCLSQKYKGVVDLGDKGGPFWVLIAAEMPSVLVEISHLSNAREEELLKAPAYRQQVAQGIYEGVIAYIRSLGKG